MRRQHPASACEIPPAVAPGRTARGLRQWAFQKSRAAKRLRRCGVRYLHPMSQIAQFFELALPLAIPGALLILLGALLLTGKT